MRNEIPSHPMPSPDPCTRAAAVCVTTRDHALVTAESLETSRLSRIPRDAYPVFRHPSW